MPSKLDQMIANVALRVSEGDSSGAATAAREVATNLSADDAGKLPERWYPKITSKAAGAPQFRDSWPRAWFEAIVEVLCQKEEGGIPALLELFERDNSTYHELVALRLLRLAADGIQRNEILAKLKARLPALHQTQALAIARVVVFWSEHDPKPLELLRGLASLKVKNAEGLTLGAYLKQFENELAAVQAKRAPQQASDPVDEGIICTAILALEPERFRAQAAKVAGAIGPAQISVLVNRLKEPNLTVLQSRAPSGVTNYEAVWKRAILEILGHLGTAAIPTALQLLDGKDQYVREKALRLAILLAARLPATERTVLVDQLRKHFPTVPYSDVRSVIADLALDTSAYPAIFDVLQAIGDIAVKAGGAGKIAIRDIVAAQLVPPHPPPRPDDKTACNQFAARFADAVIAKDFAAAHGMFCAPLKKQYTPKKLAALVARESKHSGPPDAFEYGDNDTTAAELRRGGRGFPKLPAHVTDTNFRRWCCLQFLPSEESEVDACFDWWMAVIEEKGELQVGFFHILDPD